MVITLFYLFFINHYFMFFILLVIARIIDFMCHSCIISWFAVQTLATLLGYPL